MAVSKVPTLGVERGRFGRRVPAWFVCGLVLVLGVLSPGLLVRAAEIQPNDSGANRWVVGYYVPYDPTSWASLQANAAALDVVAAQWVFLDACGNLSSRDNQTIKQFARENGLSILPSLLTNAGWLNHRLLTDEAVAAHAIGQIVAYVEAEGYDGLDLDLEAVEPADRPAYTQFVAALGAALHERDKRLTLALPAKPRDVTTGWAGAYDYAALGPHADHITIMAYDYRGAWSEPGPVAPYDWVESVLAFATSQIPAEKVLLGLAFYGYDWNTTSGTTRALGYGAAARLAERYQALIELDPATQSATFSYQAPAGEAPPLAPAVAPVRHEITLREAPPCPVAGPAPTPTRTPRPAPLPGTPQDHVVWLEESASAAARLGLIDRYQAGGIATWRLGLEDPRVWDLFQQWRGG
jgi:spore germination protein YaaH